MPAPTAHQQPVHRHAGAPQGHHACHAARPLRSRRRLRSRARCHNAHVIPCEHDQRQVRRDHRRRRAQRADRCCLPRSRRKASAAARSAGPPRRCQRVPATVHRPRRALVPLLLPGQPAAPTDHRRSGLANHVAAQTFPFLHSASRHRPGPTHRPWRRRRDYRLVRRDRRRRRHRRLALLLRPGGHARTYPVANRHRPTSVSQRRTPIGRR